MNKSVALSGAAFVVGLALAGAASADDQTKEFPRDWFWHQKQADMDDHNELIGKKPPKVDVSGWMNVDSKLMNVEDGFDFGKDLKGKVVLVDYWATW